MAKLYELKREMHDALDSIYGAGEATAMIRLIFHNLKGWNASDLIINENVEISEYMETKIGDIIERLIKYEPIQYILGEAFFYGMNLKVDGRVLIPRPETEELVDMIVKQNPEKDLRVLDIGTGSGAIAIALARNLKFSEVTAIDISEDALCVAKENGKALKTDVIFLKEDIFTFEPQADAYDIIVSNPPYIDESEKAGMEPNVLDYEPHIALFVPDAAPLVYYNRIAEVAMKALVRGGRLYLEINPRHADLLKEMLRAEGFDKIDVSKDAYSKMRFISCIKEK